jgi:hypothetical protein
MPAPRTVTPITDLHELPSDWLRGPVGALTLEAAQRRADEAGMDAYWHEASKQMYFVIAESEANE